MLWEESGRDRIVVWSQVHVTSVGQIAHPLTSMRPTFRIRLLLVCLTAAAATAVVGFVLSVGVGRAYQRFFDHPANPSRDHYVVGTTTLFRCIRLDESDDSTAAVDAAYAQLQAALGDDGEVADKNSRRWSILTARQPGTTVAAPSMLCIDVSSSTPDVATTGSPSRVLSAASSRQRR